MFTDPIHKSHHVITSRPEFKEAIKIVMEEAGSYIEQVDQVPVRRKRAATAALSFDAPLPMNGIGAAQTLRELISKGSDALVATSGPRCFHFVIGGATPAALGGDWLASLWDQIAYAWVSSPLAVQLEILSLKWLAEMLEIPSHYAAVMTTGATMSNFTGLVAGRQWAGEQMGFDVSNSGLSGVPQIKVFSSGHIHASTIKVLSMMGIGRSNIQLITKDKAGNLDPKRLESELRKLDGRPALLVATTGEPNAGAFDPVTQMADLADQYHCWLHIDGAFGLFAKISKKTKHLVEGIERAHSLTVDGHKWLNVPYDCGFSFVCREDLLAKSFRYTAEYLPNQNPDEPVIGSLAPESSRRARSFSVWATLKAYGLNGYREMVEHHLSLAQYLSKLIDQSPFLERLASVNLNVVCLRYNPGNLAEKQLNELNAKLGAAMLQDGRVYVGSTIYEGKNALRPAISNWRTRREDVKLLVEVVLEIGEQLVKM